MLISAVKLDFLTLTHLGGLWWTLVELQHLVFSSVVVVRVRGQLSGLSCLSVEGFRLTFRNVTQSVETLYQPPLPAPPLPSLWVSQHAFLQCLDVLPALSLSLILVPPLSLPPHGMRVFVRCCTHKDPV